MDLVQPSVNHASESINRDMEKGEDHIRTWLCLGVWNCQPWWAQGVQSGLPVQIAESLRGGGLQRNCLRICGSFSFLQLKGLDLMRDWSWGFDLVSCRLSVSGNFLFCFQMYSEIDQKKHPPQLNKIESNNKPTVIFQPVQSWDPWGVVVFQSWSRTAKGSWAWGYCCCSLSVCSEATERSLDLWGVKKHLSHVLRPWSLCKLQRKEKSLVCGSRTDASPWQERLWQVHPC